MLPILEKIKEGKLIKKTYSRVLTNKMTLIAWQLYKTNARLHFAFFLYRLRKDFGFTEWEIANLTGVPVLHQNVLFSKVKKILDGEILKTLANNKVEEELEKFRMLGEKGGLPQGYMPVRDDDNAWYLEETRKRYGSEKYFKLGMESQKEFEEKLEQRIGMLRQWLNEDRIKEPDKMITNEDIKHWLFS